MTQSFTSWVGYTQAYITIARIQLLFTATLFLDEQTTREACIKFIRKKLLQQYPNRNIDKLVDVIIKQYLRDEIDPLLLRRYTFDAIADSVFVSKGHNVAKQLLGRSKD